MGSTLLYAGAELHVSVPMKKDIARNMKIRLNSAWNENAQYNKFMHNLFVHKFPFFDFVMFNLNVKTGPFVETPN